MGNSHAQARVQEAVDHLTADGAELGLQVAVIHKGELVVDAVSGPADAARGHVLMHTAGVPAPTQP